MKSRKCLTDAEIEKITELLDNGFESLEISKTLGRDHRTIKSFIATGKKPRRLGCGQKKLSARQERLLLASLRKNPHCSSKAVFEEAKVPMLSKSQRNVYLSKIGKVAAKVARPPLSHLHKKKRVEWANAYMKTNFNNVMFTDESRISLDGPDGWRRGWIWKDGQKCESIKRQQGGGGIMIWAGIVHNKLVGPFRVPEGVKLNSANYCAFLEENVMPFIARQPKSWKNALIIQQDNAPSHASKFTKEWFEENGFKNEKMMVWPPNSPDLNCIENLWSIVKRDIYKNGKQFHCKEALWNAIQRSFAKIPSETIEKLTGSMDKRLVEILRRSGGRVPF